MNHEELFMSRSLPYEHAQGRACGPRVNVTAHETTMDVAISAGLPRDGEVLESRFCPSREVVSRSALMATYIMRDFVRHDEDWRTTVSVVSHCWKAISLRCDRYVDPLAFVCSR